MLTFYNDHENIFAGLSNVNEGNMKFREDETDDDTQKNRKNLCDAQNIPYENLISAQLVHGKDVVFVKNMEDRIVAKTDALVTNVKDLYISVTVADCFPVFFYDPVAEIVAVAHAGWRGVVAGIIPKTIAKMEELGSSAKDIHISVGPGISKKNFEFSYLEMTQEFGHFAQDRYIEKTSTMEKVKIDLPMMINDQLINAGASLENLKISRICTYDDEDFFSARRHGGDSYNAMLAVIGMRGEDNK